MAVYYSDNLLYIYFFSCSNQFEFLPTIGKEHSNSTMEKRILWQMLLNRQKALLILWIHPLRSARVFFHSVSAGPSLGAKGQGAGVVQPAAQRTSGRRCLQLLQAVLKAAVAVVAMSSRTAKNLLATACVCIGGPTYLPSLLPHLDLVPFGLRLSWSQCRCGRSQWVWRTWRSRTPPQCRSAGRACSSDSFVCPVAPPTGARF